MKVFNIQTKNGQACIQSSMDKRLLYSLAFIIPFLSMLIIYALFKIFRFGDRTNLVMDLNGQYADFFAYYHRVLTGSESLFYSFSKEMGGNVFGLFAYYLSSPFFILALFFPVSAMPEGIALVTLLKIGSCGLTFAIFLRNVFKKSDLSVILFSSAYALMTYSMHYSMCIMWLDGAIWLPIILLGVECILDNKSGWCFFVAYALTLYSNYYTAYMNTLFVGIYFFSRYFVNDSEKNIKDLILKFLKICGLGITAALLGLVILFPTFLDIFNGKMASGSYVADGFWNIDITKIPRRLFIGQYDSITNSGNPNIFCGILSGIMTSVFFFNPKVKLKEKLSSAIVFLIFFISFFIKRVDMIWHLFQYPNWYPYRYAYVFCFFALVIAFKGFVSIQNSQCKWIFAGIGFYIMILAAVWIFDREVLTNHTLAVVSCMFAAVYIAGLLIVLFGKETLKPYICICFILLTCSELVVNGYYTISGLNHEHTFKSRSEYSQKVNEISNMVHFLDDYDNGLYRTEKTFSRTDNDSMTFGYNGMTHYSSTYNNKMLNFNNKMGMLQEYILIRYMGSTILTDSMLGVKYIASENKVNDEYKEINKADTYSIYENPYAMSLGFASDSSALEAPSYGSSALENQGLFVKSIFKEDYVNAIMPQSISDSQINFLAEYDGAYYLDLKQKYGGVIGLTVNGNAREYQYDDNEKKIFYLGSYKIGDNINVTIENIQNLTDAEVYSIDIEGFKKSYQKKNKQSFLDITNYGKTWLEGTVTLDKNQILFTTIPYEKGWSVYVDGEKAEILCAQDAFLAVQAEEGEHTIKFKYSVPGLKVSVVISLMMLIGVCVVFVKQRTKKQFVK